ncbi:MAG: DUF2849 domain-containing protein [Pseudomonadota bacterium]
MNDVTEDCSEYVVTANDVLSGDTVFRTPDEKWVRGIDGAAVLKCEDSGFVALGEAQQDERANIVMGAYLVEVSRETGAIRPVHIRERIRALGPTVRADLAQVAQGFSTSEVVDQ